MNNEESLKELIAKVDKIQTAVTSLQSCLEERCPGHMNRISDIELIMHGSPSNGTRPGLLSRVASLEDAIQRINATRSWAFGVAGAALGGLIAILAEHFV